MAVGAQYTLRSMSTEGEPAKSAVDEVERLEAENDVLRSRIARLSAAAAPETRSPFRRGLRNGLYTTLVVTLVLVVLGGAFIAMALSNLRM